MKSLVLVVALVLILASCDFFVPPPSDPEAAFCGDGIVQSPNDDGIFEECDWGDENADTCDPAGDACETCTTECELVAFTDTAPEALSITAPETFTVEEGEGGFFEIELSREAQVHAWVEETSLFYGTEGSASGLAPQTIYPEGPVELTTRLDVDYPITEYSFAFDPAVRIDGIDVQFDLYDLPMRLFEYEGSLVFMNERRLVTIRGVDDPVPFGLLSAPGELTLVSVEETIVRDGGPVSAMLAITLPDGSKMMRSVRLDQQYSLVEGVTLMVDDLDEERVTFTVSALGYDESFVVTYEPAVQADVLGLTFRFELLGIIVDRDVERTATVSFDGGPAQELVEGSFAIIGIHPVFVDSITSSFGGTDDPAVSLTQTGIIRRVSGPNLEYLGFAPLEWTPFAFIEASVETQGASLVRVSMREDHTPTSGSDGNDNALDDAFLSFSVVEQWGEYRLFDSGVSASVMPDGRVTVSGARAGEYTIVIEARDGDETAQALVSFVVE
jgi:hypothetical protein